MARIPTALRRLCRPRARLAATIALLCTAGAAHAAIYVQIPNIPGEVTTEGYDDGTWFEARSGSYGAERDLVAAGKGGTADLNLGLGELLPIGLACELNRAAAPLLQAAINGNSVGDVEIHLVELEPEPVTFGIIKLGRAFVKDFTTDSPAGERPWYQAFLHYNAIEVTNRFSGPDGTTEQTTTWDLVTATGSYRDETVANQPPTISPIAPLTIAEDTAASVSFTVTDPDGPAANLSVAATSSNRALLPHLTPSGEGSSRTLTIAPAPDQNGRAVVSVVVSDRYDTVSASFGVVVTPVPDPPSIDKIAPQVTEVDTAITFPVFPSDPDQGSDTLILTATAANQRLVPDSNITFEHDGESWQMTITPAAGQAGSTEIRVTVTDDTDRSVSAEVLFTVNSDENSAPTDILLEPGAIPENSPGGTIVGTLRALDPDGDSGIVFELVSDAQGLFALVDGTTIVSTAGAEFDHEDRSSHAIFVRATDPDGAIFGRALTVRVSNVNEAPEVTLDLPSTLPATTPAAPSPVPIPYPNIAISDPDSGAGEVTVTFEVRHGVLHMDDTDTLFGRVSGNHTRTVDVHAALADTLLVLAGGGFTYLPDAGYEGADSLTVTVNDNGHSGSGVPLSASATEAFFVRADPARSWLAEFFSPEEQADPEIGGLFADFDRDNLAAVLEFKLAGNPRDSTDAAAAVELAEVMDDGQPYFQLTFVQRTDESTPHTRLKVEVADDLSGWQDGAEVVTLISRTPLGDDLEEVVYRLVRSRTEQPRQFLRLSATYTGAMP